MSNVESSESLVVIQSHHKGHIVTSNGIGVTSGVNIVTIRVMTLTIRHYYHQQSKISIVELLESQLLPKIPSKFIRVIHKVIRIFGTIISINLVIRVMINQESPLESLVEPILDWWHYQYPQSYHKSLRNTSRFFYHPLSYQANQK